MFLASKIGWAGLSLVLLSAGLLVRDSPRSAPGSDPNKEVAAGFVIKNEITKMQETLRDKGHYRGKVDGVFGLQTRDSIREYQKAKNLPRNGQVDTRTADGLGIRPESDWLNSERAGREAGHDTAGGIKTNKPSAGIRWVEGRASKTSRRVSGAAAIKDNRRDQR